MALIVKFRIVFDQIRRESLGNITWVKFKHNVLC